MRRAAALTLLPLALFTALGLVHAWTSGGQGMGIDFFQFWAVGQAVREDLVPSVYGPEAWPRLAGIFMERARRDGSRRHLAVARFRKDEIQTSNTPFLYSAFYALESGSYETDIRRFRLLSLLVTVASVVALCRAAGYCWTGTLMILTFVLWAFAPLHYDLREGNVNAIQLGCMALYVTLLRGSRAGPWREILAGAVLGAGVAFKPNLLFVPAVLILAWLLTRRIGDLARRTAGMAAGGLAAVAAGSLFFGAFSPWLRWAETLSEIQQTFGSEMKWGSFGGGRILLDLTGVNLSAPLYLLVLGGAGWAAWRHHAAASAAGGGEARSSGGADLAILGLGPLVPLLAADLAWPHYLLQALPLVIWLFRPRGEGLPVAWVATLGLAGICSSPVVDWLAPGADYAYAVPLLAGCALLYAAGLASLAGRRDAEPAAAG